MKRVWLVIIILVTALICVACTELGRVTAVVEELSNPKERLALQVLNCFKEKDKEALKALFCDVSKESETLDDEIQEAMEFMEGEIESYNENIVGGEQTSYEDGKIRKQSLDAYMQKIETDSGCVYSIRTYAYTKNEDEPEKVGISKIKIKLENGAEIVIGEYIH